jgi:hypothetical protein
MPSKWGWDIGAESNGGNPTALNPGHTPLGLREKSDGGLRAEFIDMTRKYGNMGQ